MSTVTTVFNTIKDLETCLDDLPPEVNQQCLDAIDRVAEDNESNVIFAGCALHAIEDILRSAVNPRLEDTTAFSNWLDSQLEDWESYIRDECLDEYEDEYEEEEEEEDGGGDLDGDLDGDGDRLPPGGDSPPRHKRSIIIVALRRGITDPAEISKLLTEAGKKHEMAHLTVQIAGLAKKYLP
jgi:hypothetical protein